MVDIDKLFESLETIQENCNEHLHCEECPLGKSNGYCCVTEDRPSEWSLTKPVLRLMS